MDDDTMLAMLKIDLRLTTEAYDVRLRQYLQDAKARITREGAVLNTAGSVEDASLVIMYASWMWTKRDTTEAMPRMLRYALNNRVFGPKMEAAP